MRAKFIKDWLDKILDAIFIVENKENVLKSMGTMLVVLIGIPILMLLIIVTGFFVGKSPL